MRKNKNKNKEDERRLRPQTKNSVWAVVCFGSAIILLLAKFQSAGPLGGIFYNFFERLFGFGYYLLPLVLFAMAGVFLASEKRSVHKTVFIGAGIFVLAGLGVIDVIFPESGGWTGALVGLLEIPFGYAASLVILGLAALASLLVALDLPLKIKFPERKEKVLERITISESSFTENVPEEKNGVQKETEEEKEEKKIEAIEKTAAFVLLGNKKSGIVQAKLNSNYIAPPLDILKSSSEKPTVGDLRASANIIKRTLESFGIPVEMGEINIGPKVTRYTLKPAEGVKISRITVLNSDLALALAAHPIRIEAPIPGKSLVGIEVPNRVAAVVRLGSLMNYPDFANSGRLGFALGRDVSGEPVFSDIEKMPHILIAGSTGSGKSIALHSLLISLLYKNSPESLRLILVDPKRVELSIYENLPHLVSPVITDVKKTPAVFRWLISEMDKRYQILVESGSRDIQSYNKKEKSENMPYILLVIDELADLMASYGREIEGSIVRLAQMARATGIHLVFSTQRPSVDVITGLIKANITSRIAMQVASQVDSRTILDSSGAEKLLGGGDMLYMSSELSKPKRVQGAYISEDEIKKVANFIRENNENKIDKEESPNFENGEKNSNNGDIFSQYADNDEEDELYAEAVEAVRVAKKASASLLQRRLKVGYARAARLLDIMEAKGIVGPADGAKPRDVFL